MKGLRCAGILAMACLVLIGAAGAKGATRPPIRSLSSLAEEDRTEVLILATPHTEGLPDVTAGHFAKVLEILDRWDPDAIALERLAAREILGLALDPELDPVVEQFVGEARGIAAEAQERLGIDAAGAARRMLHWDGMPAEPDAATVRKRIWTALAAYEVETAVLYWNRLDDHDDLPESIATFVGQAAEGINERVAVGVALAGRERLARLWSIDSHADKDLFLTLVEKLTAGLRAAGDAASIVGQSPYSTTPAIEKRAIEEGDLFPLYEFVNSAAYAVGDVRGQFDLFNRIEFPNDAGRARQAAWDERNYRIAANIRRVTAHHPGGRVLVVIGAGHKPFLDELLATSLDVRVVQFEELAVAFAAPSASGAIGSREKSSHGPRR